MENTLIEQYHYILASPNHHGDIINFSDEEYGKYQPTIRYMVEHGYLQDLEIDNCNAFRKMQAFPYFEEQVTEQSKNNKAPTIAINIGGNVSKSNFTVANNMQQAEPQKSHEKNWGEKYIMPIVVAVIGALGTVFSALITGHTNK